MIKNLRWASASEIGTSHIKAGTDKQDWTRCIQLKNKIGKKVYFFIVSDGAGSASMGRQGAALICYSITQKIREYCENNSDIPNDEELWSWIDSTRDLISDCANKRNIARREFAATLVAILITEDDIVTLHIGDGSIVARKLEQWTSLSWPESGEYASTTYFLIDDPSPKLRIERYKNEYSAFSLFTDGIENLALDYKNLCPHPPFFNALLNAVDNSSSSGNIKNLSKSLSDFLNSSKINERTDDDKSLIIISTK